IERDDSRACQQRDLCEPPRAAAYVEHQLPCEILGSPLRRFPEALRGDRMTRMTVELRLADPIPLHAEVVGVVRLGDEARDAMADWVAVEGVVGDQPRFDAVGRGARGIDVQRLGRAGTAQRS